MRIHRDQGRSYSVRRFPSRARLELVIAASVYLGLLAPAAAQSVWKFAPAMPTARWTLTAVTAPDGLIYAIGGDRYGEMVLNTVEVFNAVTQEWTSLSPMPTRRANPAVAASLNGRVFAFGGHNGLESLDAVEVYDPSTDTWLALAPMTVSKSGAAAVTAVDGRIYVMGGSIIRGSSEVFSQNVAIFDPDTYTWADGVPLPEPRSYFSAVLGLDGRIYTMGGRGPYLPFARDVYRYDPDARTWTRLSSLPTARYNLAAVVAPDGRIWAMGGFADNYRDTNQVERYQPSTDRWENVLPMHLEREALGGALGNDGHIYAIGGLNHRLILSSIESFVTYVP